jgi:hypothetical protein
MLSPLQLYFYANDISLQRAEGANALSQNHFIILTIV